MRDGLALFALAALLAEGAHAAPTIRADEADQHVGREVVVEGRVFGVHCSPLSCLLAFDPSFGRFTAVVQARTFAVLPPEEIERRYNGRRVRVSGTVTRLEGKPEIVVEDPAALQLVEEERRAERDARLERAVRAQTEVLERMADVLARVEELTERLVAVQERLETLLAQAEERQAALAAAQAPQLLPPGPPPGEARPRAGFEALRSVKRGMAAAQVERLLGQPLFIETTTTGWTVWQYGAGRSVTFDGRGRVHSFVGLGR